MKILFNLLLAPFIFCSGVVYSQLSSESNVQNPIDHYKMIQWTTENGLVSNNINQVFQASNGYIWLTTFNGIMIFDGIRFELFNRDNIPFLNSSAFYSVIETNNHSLLFSSQASGVVEYKSSGFTKFYNTDSLIAGVRVSFEDSKGRVWIGSNNDGLFLLENDQIHEVNYQHLKNTTLFSICEGSDGTLYFGTSDSGLVLYKNGNYSQLTIESGLNSNHVKALKKIKNDLYIGTVGGVSIYDGNELINYPELIDIEINDIAVSPDGDIWFATEVGLGRDHNGTFDFYTEKSGLPSRQISSLTFDTENNLWLTTKKSGLLQMKYSNFINITTGNGLSSNRVNSIIEKKPGVFLIGSDNGAIDRLQDGVFKSVEIDEDLENVSIKDMLFDQHDDLWIASYKGIIQHTLYEDINWNKSVGIADNQARVLHEDRNGNMWVGFKNGGLVKLGKNSEFKLFTRNNGLGSNYVLSIDELTDGTIIVGTHSGGLNFIQQDSVVEKHYPLNLGDGVLIFNTHVEENKFVWLCTNIGLFLFDLNSKTFTQISQKDGMGAETLFDLVFDDRGYVWISSNIGIVHIRKQDILDFVLGKKHKVVSEVFDSSDGMVSKECTVAKILNTQNGELWFPTLGGIVTVDPDSLRRNSFEPPVYIRKLCVDEDICYSGSDLNVVVPPGHKRYIFDFTALSFISPTKLKFRYRLDGFDNDWISDVKNRQTVYTNLKPGDYEFRVQVSDYNGTWINNGASINFYVKPLFYQTAWFYIGLIIIVGGLIYLYLSSVRKRNRQLQKLNAELDSFVYSTSHDLRAPLMSVLGLVNIAKLDSEGDKVKEYLDTIEHSVKKLDAFISDIIDYSRNSRLEITKELVNVKKLFDGLFESLTYLDPENKIKWSININPDFTEINIDKRRLSIILSNIISNCYRYSRNYIQQPFIHVNVSGNQREVIFEIEDNGKGINKEHQDKIFNMFYRASEDSNGSGLGLYIVKETIDKLGGSVAVKSEFGSGTTFYVHIPN